MAYRFQKYTILLHDAQIYCISIVTESHFPLIFNDWISYGKMLVLGKILPSPGNPGVNDY